MKEFIEVLDGPFDALGVGSNGGAVKKGGAFAGDALALGGVGRAAGAKAGLGGAGGDGAFFFFVPVALVCGQEDGERNVVGVLFDDYSNKYLSLRRTLNSHLNT